MRITKALALFLPSKQSGIAGLVVLIMLMLLLGGVFFYQSTINIRSRQWVIHNYDVSNTLNSLLAKIKQAEIEQSSPIFNQAQKASNTYHPFFMQMAEPIVLQDTSYTVHDAIEQDLYRLRMLMAKDPSQLSDLTYIQQLIEAWQNKHNVTNARYYLQSKEESVLAYTITSTIEDMIEEQNRLLKLSINADRKVLSNNTQIVATAFTISFFIIVCSYFFITRDLNRRKQAERELAAEKALLETTFNNMVQGISVFNMEFRLVAWNKRFVELLDLAPDHDLEGKSFLEVLEYNAKLGEFGTNSVEDSIEKRVKMVKSNTPYCFEHVRPNGTIMEIAGTPIPDIGFIRTFTDITERKHIEHMKNEFVSTVSHELRTPLTSIRGSLGLIAGGVVGELQEPMKKLIDIAYKNSERLMHLINDILDIEKIEAGSMKFAIETLHLAPLITQAVEANQGFGQEYGVSFMVEPLLPGAYVWADSHRLMQVLTNLLSNAAKFSPAGSKVVIGTSYVENYVRISVTDQGPGIPEEFQLQIFQKFAQADSRDNRQKGGTGLGLSIAKSLIERMNGRISFNTKPGIGTSFFIDIPVYTNTI